MGDFEILKESITDSPEKVAEVCRALSSEIRLKMLSLIYTNGGLSIMDLAKALDIAVSSASFHVEILQKANIISVYSIAGKHGTMKICNIKVQNVSIDIFSKEMIKHLNTFTYNIPIGSYSDAYAVANPTCGIASEFEILELADHPSSFFSSRKTEAQIVWASHGHLIYKIPNYFLENNNAQAISFSLEICSEAPFYNLNYPSDISFMVNNIDICTYTCKSDFGGRPGKLTPKWWNANLTQYGELKEIIINQNGAFLDNIMVNTNVTIDQLKLGDGSFISFFVGVKDDAVNKGGFNIFGEKFGDHQQNIIMKVKCI